MLNETTVKKHSPTILMILDGWGVAPESIGNAIALAKTPNFDKLCQNYFCKTLQASGEAVGLPFNEMGNSEVGHLNIGSGRIVYQNLPRINKSILDGDFFSNPIFLNACEHVKKNNSQLHLLGLISKGGVHASMDHLLALLELAHQQKIEKVFIHAILDGRDMNYDSGIVLIKELQQEIKKLGIGQIASITGRWWAMDRDNRWERTKAAYDTMVLGVANIKHINPVEAIQESYARNIYDEEFEPTVMVDEQGQPVAKINSNDAVIFSNYRADRGRQLSKAFVLPSFDKFKRASYLNDLYFASMTQYDKDLPIEVAYPPALIKNCLASVLSDNKIKQLHIAETEKYAHVTYFLNGGIDEPFTDEDDVLIPSPHVDNYVTTPAMSALEIKDKIIKSLSDNVYDFIVVNFANPDMVAHTGDLKASIEAIQVIDKCLGEIVGAILSLNGTALITADHGNAEELINLQTGDIDKEHSTAPVPFILVGKDYENREQMGEPVKLELLSAGGVLADIAPTLLKIMKIEKPDDMTGVSLV